eukprot:COSAG02_NODE_3402_length_6799_cov_44.275481_1_plen_698_part_00
MPSKGKKQRGTSKGKSVCRGGDQIERTSETAAHEKWTEKLQSKLEMGMLETQANPYFSYERCPRYTRLHKVSNSRNADAVKKALQGAVEASNKPYRAVWREVVRDHLARWEAERKKAESIDRSMWYLTANAEEIRTLPTHETSREGYTHALLVINGKQTVTVGLSIPVDGETEPHCTAFVCDYQEAHFASKGDSAEGAGHEGEDGVVGVHTVNDAGALMIYSLAKVAQKRLMSCALLDRALEGHLCLHAEVSSKLDELRRALIQLEQHDDIYRANLDILKYRITAIVKNALEAQRSGALSIEDYVRSKGVEPDSAGTYRVSGGRVYQLETVDTTPGRRGSEDGLTDEERDRGWEIIDGEKIRARIGMDLVRAISTTIGPLSHSSDPRPHRQSGRQGSVAQSSYSARQGLDLCNKQNDAQKDAALEDAQGAHPDKATQSKNSRSEATPNTNSRTDRPKLPLGWLWHTTCCGREYFRNVNAGTSHWKIPESAFAEYTAATQELLAREAEREAKKTEAKRQDDRKHPSLLHHAAYNGHEAAVTRLIAGDFRDAVDKQMYRGFTPLHVAAQKGNEVVVNLLLSHGADGNRRTAGGANALWLAAWRGSAAIVRLLLAHGVDASVRTNSDPPESDDDDDHEPAAHGDNTYWQSNATPLDIANTKGHEDVVALLRDDLASKSDSPLLYLAPEDPDPVPEDPVPE